MIIIQGTTISEDTTYIFFGEECSERTLPIFLPDHLEQNGDDK